MAQIGHSSLTKTRKEVNDMVRTEEQDREETEALVRHHQALASEHRIALEKRLILDLIRATKER